MTAAGRPATVVRWFADVVHRYGDSMAVEVGDHAYTYWHLDRYVDRLAHRLRTLGVRRGHTVAAFLPRGLASVATLLAIWRVGAGYLPLDPAHPVARSRQILRDAEPVLLVTDTADLVADATPPRMVLDESVDRSPSAEDAVRPAPVDPSDLAYVVYTSGSTGRPKGVMVEHRTLTALFRWLVPRLARPRRVLHFMPVAFDITFTETLAALLTGGTLVVVPGLEARLVDEVAAAIADHDLDTLFITPGVLHALALERRFRQECERRPVRVAVSGEQLILRAGWRVGQIEMENHYGPSETHVVTGCSVPADAIGVIAIGPPIDDVTAHVLDADLRPVPDGTVGEIFIGGESVGRGYLGQPALTAERFVPDPFATSPSGRLYQTGDLGRRDPNGSLEFIGRIDDQVKIGDSRVEPGEIEVVLRRHPAVREAVVLPRTDPTGTRYLVAYVTGDEVPIAALRGHVGAALPSYMVPSAVVWLPAMPLNGNGKVDRGALLEPDWPQPDRAAYSTPGRDGIR